MIEYIILFIIIYFVYTAYSKVKLAITNALDFGKGAGNAIDKSLGGTKDEDWCPSLEKDPNTKCTKNCAPTLDTKAQANGFCNNDFGDGWRFNNQTGQGDCMVGQLKAVCKYDASKKDEKYWNNCLLWNDDMIKNGNYSCNSDYGDGWRFTGERDQAACLGGSGKGYCKYDSGKKDEKYHKQCVIWDDIEHNGDKYCYDDYGAGWKYTGDREQAGCSAGFGRGICEYDPAKKDEKYHKQCVIWNDIESNGNRYCSDDFGQQYKYVGRNRAGCIAGLGKGICTLKPKVTCKTDDRSWNALTSDWLGTPLTRTCPDGGSQTATCNENGSWSVTDCPYCPTTNPNKKCFKGCVADDWVEHNGDKYCYNDYGGGWKFKGGRNRVDCGAGFSKGICEYDASKKDEKYWNNCINWGDIEKNGNQYCKNDFGQAYKYVGANRAECPSWQGKGICAPGLGTLSEVKNWQSQKCLDIPNGTSNNITPIQHWDCNSTNPQKWIYDINEKTIKNANGKCLDMYWNSRDNGTKVGAWDCNGSSGQQWVFHDHNTIRPNDKQDKCLDLDGGSGKVQLWDCWTGGILSNNRKWTMQ